MNKRWILAICVTASLSNMAYAGGNWSYEGPNGPDSWGYLRSSYATCATGLTQSPVDITDTVQSALPPIDFHYRLPGMPEATNTGHTIRIAIPSGRYIVVDGERYDLIQIKFHTPSEHTIEGHAFAMAAHFIHRNIKGETAIVAVMFKTGETNTALNKIWKKIPAYAGGKAHFLTLDIAPLLPHATSYYTYTGSLTEPPCTEGVRWFILKTPVSIGKEQLDRFRKVYNNNARPVQPITGRKILTN